MNSMEKCLQIHFSDDQARKKLSLLGIVDGKELDVKISE